MFTKKHYEAIAEALRAAREYADGRANRHYHPTDMLYGIGYAEAQIVALLAADNPRFDGERFAQASGMWGTK